MGFADIKNKVTNALSKNRNKIDQGIDQAAKFTDEKTGGKYSDKIDKSVDKARDYLDKQDGDDDQQRPRP